MLIFSVDSPDMGDLMPPLPGESSAWFTVPSRFMAVLYIGIATSQWVLTWGDQWERMAVLDVGVANLLPGPFQHEPPTPLELEQAIEVVEDELMPHLRLLPAQSHLAFVFDDGSPTLADWRTHLPNMMPVGIEEVEAAFQHLCALSAGRPSAAGESLADGLNAAALLIVREFMHHMGHRRAVISRTLWPEFGRRGQSSEV